MTAVNRKKILTQSRINSWLGCQQHHYNSYVLGYRSTATADALVFGDGAHKGLDVMHQTGSLKEALNAVPAIEPYADAMMEAMLTAYYSKWFPSEYALVGSEIEFCFPVYDSAALNDAAGGWHMAGKLDKIVKKDGEFFVMEHKTTVDDITPGSTYWRRKRLDLQQSVYWKAVRKMGYDVRGFIWDALVKPAIRPYSATPPEKRKYTKEGKLYASQRADDETPHEYLHRLCDWIASDPDGHIGRQTMVRLESEMIGHTIQMNSVVAQIEDQVSGKTVPVRNHNHCYRYGRECEFLPVCEMSEELENTGLYKKLDNLHPELSPNLKVLP